MSDDTPHFDDAGRLIAPKYDDVYFSATDGLAETQFVFLEGNRLAERFAAMKPGDNFTIGETGFGTGLNFLAVWQLFTKAAPAEATLRFISVEGFPLDAASIRKALSPWSHLDEPMQAMLEQWGNLWPGVHQLRFAEGRVGLTLLTSEATEALKEVESKVDAWFLDGFAPSRNPDMWSKEVFAHVARCSKPGTTLATYTAAGFVRRGLQAVGFEIEKLPGFGTKRDMTVGRYGGCDANASLTVACKATRQTETALVIGGSLAGAFAARSLAERGVAVTVLERQRLVDGELPALSPRLATLQPKVSAASDANGRWLREGYAAVRRLLESDESLAKRSGWRACGTLQLATDERTARRLRRFIDEFGSAGLCQWIDAEQTESICGVALRLGGVSIPGAGVVRPAGLCAGLLDHPRIQSREHTQAISLQRDGQAWAIEVSGGDRLRSTTVIVANALDALRFDPTKHLQLEPVRGQVSLIRAGGEVGQVSPLNDLRCPIFYGGYALPAVNGQVTLGASFIPGDTDTHWRDAEHAEVCDKLARVMPDEAERLRQIADPSGWAGLRVTTKNHRCYAEQVEPGLFISLGHGSHGIASAARAAEHIADLIANGVVG
mgnify:CR=1 FL=1